MTLPLPFCLALFLSFHLYLIIGSGKCRPTLNVLVSCFCINMLFFTSFRNPPMLVNTIKAIPFMAARTILKCLYILIRCSVDLIKFYVILKFGYRTSYSCGKFLPSLQEQIISFKHRQSFNSKMCMRHLYRYNSKLSKAECFSSLKFVTSKY